MEGAPVCAGSSAPGHRAARLRSARPAERIQERGLRAVQRDVGRAEGAVTAMLARVELAPEPVRAAAYASGRAASAAHAGVSRANRRWRWRRWRARMTIAVAAPTIGHGRPNDPRHGGMRRAMPRARADRERSPSTATGGWDEPCAATVSVTSGYAAFPACHRDARAVASVERLPLRVSHLLEHLAECWSITLIAPPSDAIPPGIARHVPVTLRGGGVTYPWRFDQTELAPRLTARFASTVLIALWSGPAPRHCGSDAATCRPRWSM